MIIITFFIVLAITTKMTNSKNGTKGISDEILTFEKSDSFIIFLCFIASIIVNEIAKKYFLKYYLVILAVSAGIFAMILIIVNVNRESSIKRKHDQIIKIYQALMDVLGRVDIEDISFEEIPFKYEIDNKTGNVNKITLDTSIPGGKFNDNTITLSQYSINKFFPECQWTSEVDYPNRTVTFIGLPKPPDIAKWPGDDYRPTGWIALGLSGAGEVGWNLSGPKSSEMGQSSYIDEDGHTPDYVNLPSAPQALCVGSTGGGKSIWINQKVQIIE